MENFIRELAFKIKIASAAKVAHPEASFRQACPERRAAAFRQDGIVAVGASTGGPEAICEVLREFPSNMPGVVIVQHMPPVFTAMYA
jgi:two-component system chemotaxis response regulator CheB